MRLICAFVVGSGNFHKGGGAQTAKEGVKSSHASVIP